MAANPPQVPGFRSETYNPDRLIAGSADIVTETAVIGAGANLERGTLLGVITASGKFVQSTAAASDGSETPVAILVDHAPAASADASAGIYVAGEFNENAIIYGAGHTAASVKAGLRARGIYLKTPIPA
ncbi:head decoration protein [Roseomonas xinghualingensis]|uniref:head decoration protein n=1 Tax=Roseomonas xinghualingensis TaxID=2986475 RepID=UPI0021F0B164|nr:head decoration protein [Roseomonas sp. SXEYE001]MCV4207564.1 head decoration protein [Roseomonas sp. SXEYE001]